jgi:hypothetical protein
MNKTNPFNHETPLYPGSRIEDAAVAGYERNPLLSPNVFKPIRDGIRAGLISHLYIAGKEAVSTAAVFDPAEFAQQIPETAALILYGLDLSSFSEPEPAAIDLTETKQLKIVEGCCGKLRYEDPEPLRITHLPRIMHLGPDYDPRGIGEFVDALAKELGCGIEELPLTVLHAGIDAVGMV